MCFRLLLGACWLLLGISAKQTEVINWPDEISKMLDLFNMEWEARENYQLVRDTFTADFLRISPSRITEGDYAELEQIFSRRENMGRHILGKPQIVSTCQNFAVIWLTASYNSENGSSKSGTYAILVEYTDGRAKVKFIHTTV